MMETNNKIDESTRAKYMLILMRATIECKSINKLLKDYKMDAKTFAKIGKCIKENPTDFEQKSMITMRKCLRNLSSLREKTLKMSKSFEESKKRVKKVTIQECIKKFGTVTLKDNKKDITISNGEYIIDNKTKKKIKLDTWLKKNGITLKSSLDKIIDLENDGVVIMERENSSKSTS